jgi:NADPH-dependent 7-cyano-7-deazaguanine reductase QueF
MTLKETKMVLVSDLKGVSAAQDFINLYKSSFEQLGDFQNNKIKIITQENLKKLIESDNFEAYNQFYDLNY